MNTTAKNRSILKIGAVLMLARHANASPERLELAVLKELEGLRLCSRVAPMLGLVATMIPMGPALVAVASGQSQGVAESLAPAFAPSLWRWWLPPSPLWCTACAGAGCWPKCWWCWKASPHEPARRCALPGDQAAPAHSG